MISKSRLLKRAGSAISILAAAAYISMPRPEYKEVYDISSFEPWQKEMISEAQAPWEREAARFATLATEADMNDPEVMKSMITGRGYGWDEWNRQCRECEWLESDEAKRLYETAKRFGVEEVAYALPAVESGNRHMSAKGDVVESSKGAIGKLQILGNVGRARNGRKRVSGGFDEIWHIYNDPLPHQKGFITKYRDALNEYRTIFTGGKREVWERLKDEHANEVAGFIYLGFLKELNHGNMDAALEMYNAGIGGRKKYPNNAMKYRLNVKAKQRYFETLSSRVCPEIRNIQASIKTRLEDIHYRGYLSSLLDYNR